MKKSLKNSIINPLTFLEFNLVQSPENIKPKAFNKNAREEKIVVNKSSIMFNFPKEAIQKICYSVKIQLKLSAFLLKLPISLHFDNK